MAGVPKVMSGAGTAVSKAVVDGADTRALEEAKALLHSKRSELLNRFFGEGHTLEAVRFPESPGWFFKPGHTLESARPAVGPRWVPTPDGSGGGVLRVPADQLREMDAVGGMLLLARRIQHALDEQGPP